MSRAYLAGASWWDADCGPPNADVLPRAQKIAATLNVRSVAHVVAALAEQPAVDLSQIPWILASPTPSLAVACHRSLVMAPVLSRWVSPISAGHGTVAMALLEALGVLATQPTVLVVGVQQASIPHSEASAVAILLARDRPAIEPRSLAEIAVHEPSRIRTTRDKTAHEIPTIEALCRVARAAVVAEPTTQSIAWSSSDRSMHARVDLTFPE